MNKSTQLETTIRIPTAQYERNDIEESIYANTTVKTDCTSITMFNQGDVAATIAGVLVEPKESIEFPGDPGVINKSRYRVAFDSQTTGTKPKIVIHRVYVTSVAK